MPRRFLCLLLLTAGVLSAGCATFAAKSELRYGKGWTQFAAQASSSTSFGSPAAPAGPVADPEADAARHFKEAPQAQEAVRRAQRVLRAKKPSPRAVREALDDIERAEGLIGRLGVDDPRRVAELRARLAELRRLAETRLAEVLTIEPSVNVIDAAKRRAVRVAVVKIGEGIETVRRAEALLWRAFLAEAGFDGEVRFIASPVAGADPTAADLRVAAARLGADLVLAYTTSAATTIGPLHESVAVLSFAKCMVVDTRSEYLFLNAEGEHRTRRIGVPFTLTPRSVELAAIHASVGALRDEIGRELARLVATATERAAGD
ncbi:MAG: hypothetical protein ACYTGX_09330 [Planctomycetota bacterium]|jgi:hypothetical protein